MMSLVSKDRPRWQNAGRVATVFLCTLMIAATQLGMAPSAHASNFGSTPCGGSPVNCVSLTDNRDLHWCEEGTLGNQIPGIYTSTVESMEDYRGSTVLDPRHLCPITSSRDVVVTDASYGNNGLFAWVRCRAGSGTSGQHPNRICDSQKLRYNGWSGYEYAYDTYSKRLSRACHEIGHTVGLRHTSNENSCMAPYSPDRSTLTSLHDDDHINGTY